MLSGSFHGKVFVQGAATVAGSSKFSKASESQSANLETLLPQKRVEVNQEPTANAYEQVGLKLSWQCMTGHTLLIQQ